MNATVASELPADLIRALYESDRATGGRPALPAGERERARAWLRRALVDFGSLEQHVRLLQELYGAPFRLPRPRRDCWTAEQLRPPAEPSNFRHTARLADERVAAVADEGPEALADEELATLLLNPFALYDLFDVIDDLAPERWTGVMAEVGRSLAPAGSQPAAADRGERVLPYPAPAAAARAPAARNGGDSIPWARRHAVALAAGVMVALTAGLIAATAVAVRSSQEAAELRGQVAELQGKLDRFAKNTNPGPTGLLEWHGDVPRPADWQRIWDTQYKETDPPSENVRRLYAASGPKVKEMIDDMRKKNYGDLEILAALKLAFGPRDK